MLTAQSVINVEGDKAARSVERSSALEAILLLASACITTAVGENVRWTLRRAASDRRVDVEQQIKRRAVRLRQITRRADLALCVSDIRLVHHRKRRVRVQDSRRGRRFEHSGEEG